MNGLCTYTVVVHDDEGAARDVPCGKPRVGEVNGPGIRVVLCNRHAKKVARALMDNRELVLTLDGEEGAV